MIDCIPRILVVDDDPDMRTMAHDYLTRQGCAVSLAADGAEALALMIGDLPDVILLDIRLLSIIARKCTTSFRQ